MNQKKSRWLLAAFVVVSAGAFAFQSELLAFCGFYVAKADTRLFNRASRVVLVRDGQRTVVTMASDYRGAARDFALVIPVPTVLRKEQIHIGRQKDIDHLDAFTAPRLVEYFDRNPCQRPEDRRKFSREDVPTATSGQGARRPQRALRVKVEASYTVGEYDIKVLSSTDSGDLLVWLKQNGYRVPSRARPIVRSYLRQGLKFFVAKVNLGKQQQLGFSYLRPLQMAYNSERFMLPVRLGTVNADGPQDLFLFALTRSGRVEATNYRTVKIPSGQQIPTYVKTDFAHFYRDMFGSLVRREGRDKVYLEYAWNMAWCDPCAADPLTGRELRGLGVFWAADSDRAGAAPVYVTRLHARYDQNSFPNDLRLQVTPNKQNFQGRYVLRHAWKGSATCAGADEYRTRLSRRREKEAQTLAHLTGWSISDIRRKMGLEGKPVSRSDSNFWERLWRR